MPEKFVEKFWNSLIQLKKINPHLLARKFKLDLNFAQRVCQHFWLRMHKEARSASAELDFNWPSQMDRVRMKNLEKFKRKKK